LASPCWRLSPRAHRGSFRGGVRRLWLVDEEGWPEDAGLGETHTQRTRTGLHSAEM